MLKLQPPQHLPLHAEDEGSQPGNNVRARWAYTGLAAFCTQTGQEMIPEELESVIGDFLCDLAHFCDRTGVDLQARLWSAANHYQAETRRKGTQFVEMA